MDKENIYKEFHFKAVRSSGSGGQHVNKVSSKVELSFDIPNSQYLSDEEKERLLKSISSRLTKDGVLQISSGESRSQHTNKEKVIKRFFEIIDKGLFVPKKRKATTPSKIQKQKRREEKQKNALKKTLRKKPSLE